VVTPYFIPDQGLITALNVAAMRGVEVDILIPAKGNLRVVQWASTAQLWQVLQRGCRIWLSPPPFDHSKLMLIDDDWALVGSANWDARSLRLNFEFNVECYDASLSMRLQTIVDSKLAAARPLRLAEVDGRKLPVRLRDGVARLFAPYL
jgi:cardiolipin synthase